MEEIKKRGRPAKGTEVVTASNLELQVSEESAKRKTLARYVNDNMVSGTDYYTLRIGGRETKPSLSKPGSEKILSLFHWRAEFKKDDETWEMLGRPNGILCYLCKLYTIKDSLLIGEGRGARDIKKDGNDVNKGIKMAEKSAQIDAVLRTGGLSDLFTQDVEDMEEAKPMPSYQVKRVVPPADDEAGGAVIKDDIPEGQIMTRSEIAEVQKENIKQLLLSIGEEPQTVKEAKDIIRELTELELAPENYATIVERLRAKVEESDPLKNI